VASFFSEKRLQNKKKHYKRKTVTRITNKKRFYMYNCNHIGNCAICVHAEWTIDALPCNTNQSLCSQLCFSNVH